MKKLLCLSVLAATLASTAAFAGPDSSPGAKAAAKAVAGQGNNPGVVKLVVSNNAGPGVAAVLAALNSISPDAIQVKTINFGFDKRGGLTAGKFELYSALTDTSVSKLATAIMSNAQAFNQGLGWKACVAVLDNAIPTVTCINSTQDSPLVHAYAVNAVKDSSTIIVKEVKAKQDVVAELTSAKKRAKLIVAVTSN